jgi:hypothetical protein
MKPGQAYFYSGPRKAKWQMPRWMGLSMVLLIGALFMSLTSNSQQQNSGGQAVTITGTLPTGTNQIGHVIADSGSTTAVTGNVTAVQPTGSNLHVAVDSAPTTAVTESGVWTVQPGNTANTTAWKVDGSAVTQPVSGTVTNGAGVANMGIVRSVPSGCTQSTNFSSSTVGVGTGAGTSVTSTTTCVTDVYVNNITNSAVTFRLADKTGTPIIWIGGNADFTIPANSNVRFPLGGVTFTGGITAIAGTSSALNLQVNGLQ